MDAHKPFWKTRVTSIPSPATTGQTMAVLVNTATGQAPAVPFSAVVRRPASIYGDPTLLTSTRVRITAMNPATGVITLMTRDIGSTGAFAIGLDDEVYQDLDSLLDQTTTDISTVSTSVTTQGTTLSAAISAGDAVNAATIAALNTSTAADFVLDRERLGYTVDPARFNFSAITPNVSLTAGVAATITLSSGIKGVSGDPTNLQYLYISNGTGTAEAVRITGGTATSGVAGTIIFTPANSHSGSWTLSSASGGIKEAMIAHPTYLITISEATHLYAPIYMSFACAGIVGNTSTKYVLYVHFTNSSIIVCPEVGGTYVFRGFQIAPLATMTAGAAIDCTGPTNLTVSDLFLGIGGASGALSTGIQTISPGSNRVNVRDTWIHAMYQGLHIAAAYFSLDNVQVLSESTYLNYIPGSSALYLRQIAGGFISNFIHDAGVYQYGMVLDASAGSFVNEVSVSNLYLDNWFSAGIYTLTTGGGFCASWEYSSMRIVDDHSVWADSIEAACMYIDSGVENWQISASNIQVAYGLGIELRGPTDFVLQGVSIYPNIAATGKMIGLTAGTPKNIVIDGCAIGYNALSDFTAAYGILGNVATDRLTVVGNFIAAGSQANAFILAGSDTKLKIANNSGLGNAAKSVASSASLIFPVMDDQDVISITGNNAVSAVSGLREGQTGFVIFTHATPVAWSTSSTIASAPNGGAAPVQNVLYPFAFTGGKIYFR